MIFPFSKMRCRLHDFFHLGRMSLLSQGHRLRLGRCIPSRCFPSSGTHGTRTTRPSCVSERGRCRSLSGVGCSSSYGCPSLPPFDHKKCDHCHNIGNDIAEGCDTHQIDRFWNSGRNNGYMDPHIKYSIASGIARTCPIFLWMGHGLAINPFCKLRMSYLAV